MNESTHTIMQSCVQTSLFALTPLSRSQGLSLLICISILRYSHGVLYLSLGGFLGTTMTLLDRFKSVRYKACLMQVHPQLSKWKMYTHLASRLARKFHVMSGRLGQEGRGVEECLRPARYSLLAAVDHFLQIKPILLANRQIIFNACQSTSLLLLKRHARTHARIYCNPSART